MTFASQKGLIQVREKKEARKEAKDTFRQLLQSSRERETPPAQLRLAETALILPWLGEKRKGGERSVAKFVSSSPSSR